MTLHAHQHQHAAPERKLRLAMLLTAAVLVGEVVGGILSNSLALLSDAGHVLTDLVALVLSWWAVRQVEKAATAKMTYGYHRVGIIVALVNALSLVAVSLGIFYGAFLRLRNPEPVEGFLMMVVAAVGLLANLLVVAWLRSESQHNLNVRSAFWHAWGDSLSSIGVIGGGVAIVLTGFQWIDPVVSIAIGLVVGAGAWRLIKAGTNIILEASPEHLDTQEIAQAIAAVPKVKSVHDLHVWSVAPGYNLLSGHLMVEDVPVSQAEQISAEVRKMLKERFHIAHSTVQTECVACCDPEALFCNLGSKPEARP
ncbi:MAG: cobalt-zinc-cadmium efflux system protein [Dehalococcoidia bacterium]|nr:cobalt-zinc-cadmium efflux system protein [Dehalococcoidia bacterium]